MIIYFSNINISDVNHLDLLVMSDIYY